MAISLYDLSVANYLQTLGGVVGFLETGLAHFTANGVDLDAIVQTRLFPDMLPFRFQLQSVAHHSLGAIEGVKKGLFQPPPQAPAYDYRGLQQLVGDAREALQKMTPAEVNALEGKDVVFQLRDFRMPFSRSPVRLRRGIADGRLKGPGDPRARGGQPQRVLGIAAYRHGPPRRD